MVRVGHLGGESGNLCVRERQLQLKIRGPDKQVVVYDPGVGVGVGIGVGVGVR